MCRLQGKRYDTRGMALVNRWCATVRELVASAAQVNHLIVRAGLALLSPINRDEIQESRIH